MVLPDGGRAGSGRFGARLYRVSVSRVSRVPGISTVTDAASRYRRSADAPHPAPSRRLAPALARWCGSCRPRARYRAAIRARHRDAQPAAADHHGQLMPRATANVSSAAVPAGAPNDRTFRAADDALSDGSNAPRRRSRQPKQSRHHSRGEVLPRRVPRPTPTTASPISARCGPCWLRCKNTICRCSCTGRSPIPLSTYSIVNACSSNATSRAWSATSRSSASCSNTSPPPMQSSSCNRPATGSRQRSPPTTCCGTAVRSSAVACVPTPTACRS